MPFPIDAIRGLTQLIMEGKLRTVAGLLQAIQYAAQIAAWVKSLSGPTIATSGAKLATDERHAVRQLAAAIYASDRGASPAARALMGGKRSVAVTGQSLLEAMIRLLTSAFLELMKDEAYLHLILEWVAEALRSIAKE